ncbi:MAG TPA: chloramphenicol acetyltransferase [Chitinophagales bacterium]|nr:chloramphenicol acetyltransferase [Chitinophagales bacterium]HMU98186.1 chloramphenicol acetyltransferase [Chitinophagales bacterium]HMV02582.1 chloramphenicol acetyltransferase [Chitinophagales bacterium]HMW94998.1 chloramphenicol acetyltransferase [Chitinophagales bacterium]HMY42383.1 chloramphenicol acetyltransferase [Chitinophagales bacterium]
MKKLIDLDNWNRKEHFLFFSKFDEPFFGVTVKVDCTIAYQKAKEKGVSFFLYYLYRALKAANEVENFRYRIIENQPYDYATTNASPTINRPNGTFGFAYINYFENENKFYEYALQEIENVKKTSSLMPSISGENVIHFSAIPWIDFTSISHARNFSHPDSCPKISFGKMTENNGQKEMSVSIHVHHALMDGYHVGLFIEKFQSLLSEA